MDVANRVIGGVLPRVCMLQRIRSSAGLTFGFDALRNLGKRFLRQPITLHR
jgi:hypothetical protein